MDDHIIGAAPCRAGHSDDFTLRFIEIVLIESRYEVGVGVHEIVDVAIRSVTRVDSKREHRNTSSIHYR
jgi:hypothetical protein